VISQQNAAGVTFQQDAIQVEATILAEGLGFDASLVPALLKSGEITSLCERGAGDEEGRHRLAFFHRGKWFRILIDNEGRAIQRSTIDFGALPCPGSFAGRSASPEANPKMVSLARCAGPI
jgi:hypothetical protein